MKKMYIVAIAVPMPRSRYGHDRLQHRRDHRERATSSAPPAGSRGSTNAVELCTENCSGVKSADGRISAPTIASAWAGFMR